MVEYFLWQLIEGERQLAGILGPLLRTATPHWSHHAYEESADRRIALHLLPRDPVWLRVELPGHVARGRRIANAILLDPFEADEAVRQCPDKDGARALRSGEFRGLFRPGGPTRRL